jgi:hypothetical protein
MPLTKGRYKSSRGVWEAAGKISVISSETMATEPSKKR